MNILSEKIIVANTLGKTNLVEKGVALSEDATTYEIMQGIADVSSGGGGSGNGGIEYTSIVYNDDNTITLIDTDGNEHTIVCEYDGDKLVSATYDGKTVELSYEDENLVGVGSTTVNLSSAKFSYNIAQSTLAIAPNLKGTATIEPSGSVEIMEE